jgi:hypothetical protein
MVPIDIANAALLHTRLHSVGSASSSGSGHCAVWGMQQCLLRQILRQRNKPVRTSLSDRFEMTRLPPNCTRNCLSRVRTTHQRWPRIP